MVQSQSSQNVALCHVDYFKRRGKNDPAGSRENFAPPLTNWEESKSLSQNWNYCEGYTISAWSICASGQASSYQPSFLSLCQLPSSPIAFLSSGRHLYLILPLSTSLIPFMYVPFPCMYEISFGSFLLIYLVSIQILDQREESLRRKNFPSLHLLSYFLSKGTVLCGSFLKCISLGILKIFSQETWDHI